ncbi:hypothetical protein NH340_JMT09146 [Sarcoptes scabiei]|nr:hypothetical protein NH340_JMT09146 [Sarcoptes scabiei]
MVQCIGVDRIQNERKIRQGDIKMYWNKILNKLIRFLSVSYETNFILENKQLINEISLFRYDTESTLKQLMMFISQIDDCGRIIFPFDFSGNISVLSLSSALSKNVSSR